MKHLQISRSFGILNRTFLNHISDAIADKDISYSDSIFLVNIGNEEGMNQEALAELLAIDKAAIARSVKNLEKKGYIRIGRSEADKRVKELFLTDEGKLLFNDLQALNQRWVDLVLSEIEQEDLLIFSRVIDQICKRAKDLSASGFGSFEE